MRQKLRVVIDHQIQLMVMTHNYNLDFFSSLLITVGVRADRTNLHVSRLIL